MFGYLPGTAQEVFESYADELGTQSVPGRWWLWRGWQMVLWFGCEVFKGLLKAGLQGGSSGIWNLWTVGPDVQASPQEVLLEGGAKWRMWNPVGGSEATETCLQRREWNASFASWPQGGQFCFGLHHGPKSNVIMGLDPARQKIGRVRFELLFGGFIHSDMLNCMLVIIFHSLDVFYFKF